MGAHPKTRKAGQFLNSDLSTRGAHSVIGPRQLSAMGMVIVQTPPSVSNRHS